MKDILEQMTGIPASVGICEPIEGYGEHPQAALDAMKEMAGMIEGLRWSQDCCDDALKRTEEMYQCSIEALQYEVERWRKAYEQSLDPIVREKMLEPVKIYWPPCVSGRGQTGHPGRVDADRE